MATKSQDVAADVSALLRARNPLLWITTREEARVERYLIEAAAAAGYTPRTWDIAQGVTDPLTGKVIPDMGGQDPGATLSFIQERASNKETRERGLWIMRDLHPWIEGAPGASVVRNLRNVARLLPGVPRERAQAIIVITPSGNVPAELTGHATVLDWPLPDREEIAATLDAAIKVLPKELQETVAPNGTREAAIDAAVGLSGEEAAACYAKSLVQYRKIDPVAVAKEKRRVVTRERVLEWYDPLVGGLDAVGGLDNLKAWLKARATAYSPEARAYGLPAPKGTFVAGISGCGKSLTCKAIATTWAVPLLRLDFGALKSKFVGDSEANLRKALAVIEAIGRCVVWVDEVEKAMQGATSGSADGGVSADALGAFLTWMEERRGGAFVIATANDITALPPEFLRKGRFDEVWWVDLPTLEERVAVLTAALKAHNRNAVTLDIDLNAVAEVCKDFTGSEVASLVPDALYTAFGESKREPNTADLLLAASNVTPLSKTASEKIDKMRKDMAGRARSASILRPAEAAVAQGTRKIDFE